MKQSLPLPGIELPAPRARGGTDREWPPLAELMHAVAECDLPRPKPPTCLPPVEEEALSPITVLGLGLCADNMAFSPETSRVVETSNVLVAEDALLARLAHCGAEKIPLRTPFREMADILLEHRRAGKRVTVLTNGDPLFFGIGSILAKLLPTEALRILPGISQLQEVCARARLPWHDVLSVSLRGKNGLAKLAVAAIAGKPICLPSDTGSSPAVVARFLLDRGVDWHDMLIFENMGNENENMYVCALDEAAALDFRMPCTALLIPNAPPRRARLGLPDPEPNYGENRIFTRRSVRAAALAALCIAPHHVLWVLEADFASTALEASSLAHKGGVFAVEQDPARVVYMEESRRRCGAANMEIILGRVPDCLDDLPDPDAVFLGGIDKEKDPRPLLERACARLKKGGRLVAGCALLGSLEHARAALGEFGLHCEITCMQLSEAAPSAGNLRLAALDPVFLIACTKESPC